MENFALLTGASEGIGKAIAIRLASSGFNLVLTARDAGKLRQLKAAIAEVSPGSLVYTIACDLSKKENLQSLVASIVAKEIHINILVNNLGIFKPARMLDEEDAAFEEMMFINAYVPYYLSKIFGKKMAEKKSGHIFGIVSVAGRNPVAGAGSYSASKFAHFGLMQNLRIELKKSNVYVTSISPGSTLTSSWGDTQIPAELFIQPDDIALAVINCLQMSKGANIDEIIISPLNF